MGFEDGVKSTWNNKILKFQENSSSMKCHGSYKCYSNRDRIHNPNHLPYSPAHSEFYKLPYETIEELRLARRIAQKKGVMPGIEEDIDPNNPSQNIRKFVPFDTHSDKIAKEDIEGKHFRRKTSYSNLQMSEFFGSKPIKKSSSFAGFLNEQDQSENADIATKTRNTRSNSF